MFYSCVSHNGSKIKLETPRLYDWTMAESIFDSVLQKSIERARYGLIHEMLISLGMNRAEFLQIPVLN